MSYPSPLLAEKFDREVLDAMLERLEAKCRDAPVVPEPEPEPPEPPGPVHDGSDRMSEYMRASAMSRYIWMDETIEGGNE